jgi:hypothetical protein
MAIYRPSRPRGRALALTAVLSLVVGGLVGWAMGNAREPDPIEAVRSIRSSLSGVSGALEVVAIEYAEAVDGDEVVAEAEYEGARAAAERARSLFGEIRAPLELLVPDSTDEIDASLDGLVDAVDSTADEDDVTAIARATAELLANFGAP